MLTLTQYAAIFVDAVQADSRDAFVSDWSLSSVWGDPPEAEIPQSRIDALRSLWRAANYSIGEMCQFAAISKTELSQIAFIPYRTVMNWSADDSKIPIRDRYLILRLLKLLPEL